MPNLIPHVQSVSLDVTTGLGLWCGRVVEGRNRGYFWCAFNFQMDCPTTPPNHDLGNIRIWTSAGR